MSRTSIKKISVAAGLVSFTLIFFGSWVYGARIFSRFFQRIGGICNFWFVDLADLRGWAAMKPEENPGGRK